MYANVFKGGGKFKKLVRELEAEGKSHEQATGLAATIGRRKYGPKKFAQMAAAGKKTKKSEEAATLGARLGLRN